MEEAEKSDDDGEDEELKHALEEEEEQQNEQNQDFKQNMELGRPSWFRRTWASLKMNLFQCEWLDKTEINRELGESHEIGLMEGR
mmetsp:Transcript_21577/g.48100  ORF Transcript_21577/g.48100 Transcript_21577/m.48100 type:complete len:85 (+) Transcript_21577:1174-1428(+)